MGLFSLVGLCNGKNYHPLMRWMDLWYRMVNSLSGFGIPQCGRKILWIFFSCAGIAKRGTRTSCGLQRKKLRTSKKKRGPTIILRMISIKKSWMFVREKEQRVIK